MTGITTKVPKVVKGNNAKEVGTRLKGFKRSRSSRIDCVLRNSEALSNRPISDPVIPALLFAAGSETSPLAFLSTLHLLLLRFPLSLLTHSLHNGWRCKFSALIFRKFSNC